ncbi:hypothetical protein LEP1GSC190_19455 (plasmid) [Leptospira mayottensis 200901116]|nr:hypothetical protein LEP1GSC190_19455 [Leptospira mayottensis 200901116]
MISESEFRQKFYRTLSGDFFFMGPAFFALVLFGFYSILIFLYARFFLLLWMLPGLMEKEFYLKYKLPLL